MPRGIEAIVEPEMLQWARRTAGLDLATAAKRAQIKPELLENWEQRGTARPTIVQLRKLGTIYKRPLAVFYLPAPPTEFQAMRDFRRLPEQDGTPKSTQLLFEMRRAQSRREFAVARSKKQFSELRRMRKHLHEIQR